MKTLSTLAASVFGVAAIVLAAAPALAQTSSSSTSSTTAAPAVFPTAAASGFAEIDLDRDGIVSRDEISVQPVLSERFAEFDLNGDGVLSQTEFATLRTAAGQRGPSIQRR